MKYLKKLFESIDDADIMARYQLFGSDTTIAFHFNNEYITDVESIKDLIEKYNKYYIEENSWMGGPPPIKFIRYFNTHYSSKKNANSKSFYPTIELLIKTIDYGSVFVGFSITKKSISVLNFGKTEVPNSGSEKYHQEVLREISSYFKIDCRNLNINQVINYLNLKVINSLDWVWNDKI